MQISVASDIAKAAAKLRSITEAQQFRFAVATALTRTAYDVQKEVRANMPQRFTLRRDWIVRGIMVDRATKLNLTARVYSRDKFMGRQEAGGPKDPLRNYIAIPTKAVRRTAKDLIRRTELPSSLGDRAHIVTVNVNKFLALKKARKGKAKNELRLLYLLVPRARVNPRLGLGQDGRRVAPVKFAEHLRQALQDAVRTAR